MELLVDWSGNATSTWEPLTNVSGCIHLLQIYFISQGVMDDPEPLTTSSTQQHYRDVQFTVYLNYESCQLSLARYSITPQNIIHKVLRALGCQSNSKVSYSLHVKHVNGLDGFVRVRSGREIYQGTILYHHVDLIYFLYMIVYVYNVFFYSFLYRRGL